MFISLNRLTSDSCWDMKQFFCFRKAKTVGNTKQALNDHITFLEQKVVSFMAMLGHSRKTIKPKMMYYDWLREHMLHSFQPFTLHIIMAPAEGFHVKSLSPHPNSPKEKKGNNPIKVHLTWDPNATAVLIFGLGDW